MKTQYIATLISLALTSAAFAEPAAPQAQRQPATAIPAGVQLPPVPSSRGRVDEVLAGIQKNLYKGDSADEQAEEQSLGRNLTMFKNGSSALKPIGFVQTGSTKYALAKAEDGSVMKLREGRSYGPVKIHRIEDDGVSYSVGQKQFFAPIAFVPTDLSKAQQKPGGNTAAPQATSK